MHSVDTPSDETSVNETHNVYLQPRAQTTRAKTAAPALWTRCARAASCARAQRAGPASGAPRKVRRDVSAPGGARRERTRVMNDLKHCISTRENETEIYRSRAPDPGHKVSRSPVNMLTLTSQHADLDLPTC